MSRAQLIVFMALVLGAGLLLLINLVEVDLTDFRVQQAFVAGLVVASGWLITFLLREASVLLDVRERRRDMIRAVRAEVELVQFMAEKLDCDQAIHDIEAEYAQDPNYKPLVAYGQQSAVLKRLVGEIEILDTGNQIRAVIDMYQLMDRMAQLETLFAEPGFAELDADRQVSAIRRYFKMYKVLPSVAERVLTQLPRGT